MCVCVWMWTMMNLCMWVRVAAAKRRAITRVRENEQYMREVGQWKCAIQSNLDARDAHDVSNYCRDELSGRPGRCHVVRVRCSKFKLPVKEGGGCIRDIVCYGLIWPGEIVCRWGSLSKYLVGLVAWRNGNGFCRV